MSKKSKITLTIVGVILLVILVIGASFAYLSISGKQELSNNLKSACLEINIESESDSISIEKAYPITEEEGKKLKPYTFTIKNTCNNFVDYSINLEILNSSTLEAEYVRGALNLNEAKKISEFNTVTATLKDAKASYQLETGVLGGQESFTRDFRMWIDYDATKEEAAGKTMQNKIVVIATPREYTCKAAGIENFGDCLIATEYSTSNVENAKERIQAKTEPDFSKIAPNILYRESDSTNIGTTTIPIHAYIGTGYTFDKETGNYTITNYTLKNLTDISNTEYQNNNYYTCGSSISWIYAENRYDEYIPTSCSKLYKINSASTFIQYDSNLKENRTYYKANIVEYSIDIDDTSFSDSGLFMKEDDLGLSYYYRGNVNNIVHFGGFYWRIIRINGDGSIRLLYYRKNLNESNANIANSNYNVNNNKPLYVGYMYNENGTTYEEVSQNVTSSTIKQVIDKWYEQNIKSTEYESYLADSGFCNDRSLASDSIGTGIETNVRTTYKGYERLITYKTPVLKCPQKNDLFTLKVANGGNASFGNNALDYPIGLLTADELALAGAVNEKMNTLSYLSEPRYLTMTPYSYTINSYAMILGNMKNNGIFRFRTNDEAGIRPVINLKSNIKVVSGNGTATDPYEISI